MSEIISSADHAAATFAGQFRFRQWRGGVLIAEDLGKNLVVNEGIDYILGASLNGVAQEPGVYIGVFKGNYTPAASETAATIASAATESADYDEVNRPAWGQGAVSAQTLSNSGSEAQITMNASVTLYGAFLITDNIKNGTNGVLVAARRFAASRGTQANDIIQLQYDFAGASA